nr:porin [Shimwellia pseudoproteus]
MALAVLSVPAHADITVLSKNKTGSAILDPLTVAVGGSLRPGFVWNNGPEPGYYKNGYDTGSRLHAVGSYDLSDHTSLIAYYEMGLDMGHVLKWDAHYDHDGYKDIQRQMYGGIKDDTWGTLTYGHQYGVYYDTVGGKSDMWDNDGLASANWIGFNGDYDGGERPKNTIKYSNTWGKWTVRADYLLPEDEKYADESMRYRRNHGMGLGVEYAFQDDLTLGAAWNQTTATVKDDTNDGQSRKYKQKFSGMALTWTPNNWYLVTTATYYDHYVPSRRDTANATHYFAGDGYGLEAFGGYTFNIDKPWLTSIMPYVAQDTLRLKGGENYQANHTYVGVWTTVAYGFSFYLERTFASSSDNEPDTTWFTIYYDF